MRVLYGVCSWGLGHATRSLPIIRRLIQEGYDVTIISTGRPLELLNMELKDTAEYWDFPDYPLPYTERSKVFIIKFCFFAPRLLTSIISEHKKIMKLIRKSKFDIIVSDNRYGVFHKNIPSFFITHQLRLISPARIKLVENTFERFTFYFRTWFKNFLVPDYEEDGISGALSHDLNLHNLDKIEYLGILSDFKTMDVGPDVDYLFSISGPEPQRQVLEDLIFKQINDINGKIILSLGRNLDGKVEELKNTLNHNIQIYDFLPREERELILNRSKFIISRSGYSTMMDIYGLGKKAMFIPTPQQTEQEYLAKYHEKKGNFHYVNQDELDLKKDLVRAKDYKGPDRKSDIKKTVDKFMDIIHS